MNLQADKLDKAAALAKELSVTLKTLAAIDSSDRVRFPAYRNKARALRAELDLILQVAI